MPEFLEKKSIPSHDPFVGGLKGKQALLNNCGLLLSAPNAPANIPTRSHSISFLPEKVKKFVEDAFNICGARDIHVCDGSEEENKEMLQKLQDTKTIVPLPKYQNCWLARTDPRDVARVESKTFIATSNKRDTQAETKQGVKSQLANWISLEDSEKAISERFPGCMKGRTMYVIPFSMGPVGGALSKIGVQVTDSPYVVASMRVMTRIGRDVLDQLIYSQESGSADSTLVTALHSVGKAEENQPWPCDPERTIILHMPEENKIVSYGSGYGGNSLLGKKCFALRIGSTIARREGWLAEHMLILGITPPNGEKKYIAAAFPSACGKTNLAMMLPSLPGYKIECVGDDIAWIRFDKKTGMLHAINPEAGIFGVAPGTSNKTNPNAMATVSSNTIFTNVAMTSDGGVWWEGLPEPEPGVTITDWLGKPWNKDSSKTKAAHPNSRFCAPMSQCPIVDPRWEDSAGVPISAILFGGRRPEGVPLIYEAFDWAHGVFIGASMRSEATAAAEHKGKAIMHDPFAMRPFFGYNFGQYLEHWLSMENIPGVKLPKVFHVNWFRKNQEGQFMWPGFGDNIRVLDWILKRVDGDGSIINKSPIGYIPKQDSIKINDLKEKPDMEQLLSVPKDFWLKEAEQINTYLEEQIPYDTPKKISEELLSLKLRLEKSN